MKNVILAATAALALTVAAGTASAQAVPLTEVGVAAGTVDGDFNAFGARAQFGDITTPFGTNIEVTFDGARSSELIGVNLVAERALTDRVGVYALGGLGYAWIDNGDDAPTWTYGAGATYRVNDRVEFDLRARTINSFENRSDNTIYTLGVNFAF